MAAVLMHIQCPHTVAKPIETGLSKFLYLQPWSKWHSYINFLRGKKGPLSRFLRLVDGRKRPWSEHMQNQ